MSPNPTRFRNVVVFGDSLSDIGRMFKTPIGRLAKIFGAMTVSPTGRYSDCRNWTDHMYEAATGGQSLIEIDAHVSRLASKKHQSFGPQSTWGATDGPWFRYANYAVGGATGGIPEELIKRFALSTMKDQVAAFKKDLASNEHDGKFLFICWFGSNDLYTAGLPANEMTAVAEKVAIKRRNEIAQIVGESNARFVFVNMGLPLSAARYQEIHHDHKDPKTREMINNFESGALLFNSSLRQITDKSGDLYVDMASVISKDAVTELLWKLVLTEGVQEPRTSQKFISAREYDRQQTPVPISTSDKAHPTDRAYRLMWEKIRELLWENRYGLGLLGESK